MIAWIRSRAALLAEVRETREQCVALHGLLTTVEKERDQAWERLSEDFGPTSWRAQMLREKARADELAKLVDRLQAANMATDQH